MVHRAVDGRAGVERDGIHEDREYLLAGDDEMAERTKNATFDYRLIAMVAALPDAVWNVGKVLVEGSKMGSEAVRIEIVVSRAAGDAARSGAVAGRATEVLDANRAADKARHYAEIGEKADSLAEEEGVEEEEAREVECAGRRR